MNCFPAYKLANSVARTYNICFWRHHPAVQRFTLLALPPLGQSQYLPLKKRWKYTLLLSPHFSDSQEAVQTNQGSECVLCISPSPLAPLWERWNKFIHLHKVLAAVVLNIATSMACVFPLPQYGAFFTAIMPRLDQEGRWWSVSFFKKKAC